MNVPQLAEYLKNHKVSFEIIEEQGHFSALDSGNNAQAKTKDMVKTLMLWVDGNMSMMLLPSNMHIDFEQFAHAVEAKVVRMASENEFHMCFPETELGAQPAIGNLFELPVYIAKPLSRHKSIIFNGGNHHDLVKMHWSDFKALVNPIIVNQGFNKKMNSSYTGKTIISHFH
jgi:Ala-tRNA(Pro) deacylase